MLLSWKLMHVLCDRRPDPDLVSWLVDHGANPWHFTIVTRAGGYQKNGKPDGKNKQHSAFSLAAAADMLRLIEMGKPTERFRSLEEILDRATTILGFIDSELETRVGGRGKDYPVFY